MSGSTARGPAIAFSRCEHCRITLPLRAFDLAQAGGMVRCGNCGRTLNALARLYTTRPGPETPAIQISGVPPMVQPGAEWPGDAPPADADPARAGEGTAGPVLHLGPDPAPAGRRWIWPLLAVVLAGLVAWQWLAHHDWRPNLPWVSQPVRAPASDTAALGVVSRDLHPHPTRAGAMVVSAVLINRAKYNVGWPEIEVTLFDQSQQAVATRTFRPPEYLDPNADQRAGFAPQSRLPVVLEINAPGSEPAGFSMRFLDPADTPSSTTRRH